MPAGWRRADRLILAAAVIGGLAVRVALLPSEGLRGDLDQFVGWVHHIATRGLGSLYAGTDAGPVTFGPVMAYVWSGLAAVQPAFATVTDSSDPAIRALMKVPASLADFGSAAVVVYALRDRPRWAAVAGAALLLVPATWYVSAWWGQYESIFALSGLAAVVAATRGRPGVAAALVALALMTKPQAVAFLVPFAAWFWATGGWRGIVRAAVIGAVVAVVVWLPFVPSGGPAGYLRNLGVYQNEIFNVLSLRAWNAWWLVQEAGGGGFIRDDVAFAGPVTLRHVGYLVTALLSLLIARAVVRDPRPRTLILSVVASVLVVFTCMTQMHERYAFAAVPVLLLLSPEARPRTLWVALAVVFSLNLVAAVPATPGLGALIPVGGLVGITGATAMLLQMGWSLRQVVDGQARGVVPPGA
jgi:dolichyl-phosphate-mannose-protein mannosyltransferase